MAFKISFKYIFQKAQLLGFPTHAAFVLDMRMAKTPEKVETFLKDLAEKLKPLKTKDLDLFLQYKKEDVSSSKKRKECVVCF